MEPNSNDGPPFDNFTDFLNSIMNNVNNGDSDVHADFREDDNQFIIVMDAPGFEENDFSITYSNHELTISAERLIPGTQQVDQFKKSFRIPAPIADDGLSLSVNNGIVEVSLRYNDPSTQ